MRLLLAGGGTGGHLFPAVALAQRLLEEEPESAVQFVGTEKGMEATILPRLGLPLACIDISGWRGRRLAQRLRVIPQLLRSLRQSTAILHTFGPDVVVGTGGYAAGPVLLAACLQGRPTLIHEQNAEPGLTNRLLACWVDRICVSLPQSLERFGRRSAVLTGNPLRPEIEACPPLPAGEPTLLVFGGSRGARAINEAMLAALPGLEPWRGRLRILHQTGPEEAARVREGYDRHGWTEQAEVLPFIDDMAAAYARAHLVICRAGATTLAELTACGRPALLVPFPHATGDHQSANARALAQGGGGRLVPQQELDGSRLAQEIGELLGDRERLEAMAAASRRMGVTGAADRLLEECRRLARGEKR